MVGVLGHMKCIRPFTDGMNLQDIKDTELVLYNDYKPDDSSGVCRCWSIW